MYYKDLLRQITRYRLREKPRTPKPANRIPSDNFPPLVVKDNQVSWATEVLLLAYSAIFIAGWNLSFPTEIEKLLWRTAVLLMLVLPVFGTVCMAIVDEIYFRNQSSRPTSNKENQSRNPVQVRDKLTPRHLENRNLPTRRYGYYDQPKPDIPMRWLVPCTALCALYCVGRAYVLIEDIIGLRSLPSSSFETVVWTRYLPQL